VGEELATEIGTDAAVGLKLAVGVGAVVGVTVAVGVGVDDVASEVGVGIGPKVYLRITKPLPSRTPEKCLTAVVLSGRA
jgi:hypothetical protein